MPLLLRAVEAWADVPDVTTPVLKFMAEFVLNKTQRLTFDSSSPNGILLFRELSKIVVAYGSRVLTLGNVGDPYATKYKGIWVVRDLSFSAALKAMLICLVGLAGQPLRLMRIWIGLLPNAPPPRMLPRTESATWT